MKPPRRSLRSLVPLIVALLVATQVAGAQGHHGGRPISSLFSCDRPVTPPRCTSVADDLRHLIAFDESLTDGLAASLRDTMAEDYGATQLIVLEQSDVTPLTDVVAFSGDYGENGAAGWVYCPTEAAQGANPRGDRWCRGQEMHFNVNARYSVFFADDASRDHITCHELGHTVGLRHWGNPPQTSGPDVGATCMNANTPNGPTGLHEFDTDHINAYRYRREAPPPPHWRNSPMISGVPRLEAWRGSLQATEVEPLAATLDELTRAADAVVRGRIVEIMPGRVFGTDERALHYASATVAVDELLAGSLPGAHRSWLTLEIPLFDGPDSIGELPAWGEAIFFLRNKGESARAAGLGREVQASEAAFHRLLTFTSLVVNADDVALADAAAGPLGALTGLGFGDALGRVRAAAR
jgi:hypothetical protein